MNEGRHFLTAVGLPYPLKVGKPYSQVCLKRFIHYCIYFIVCTCCFSWYPRCQSTFRSIFTFIMWFRIIPLLYSMTVLYHMKPVCNACGSIIWFFVTFGRVFFYFYLFRIYLWDDIWRIFHTPTCIVGKDCLPSIFKGENHVHFFLVYIESIENSNVVLTWLSGRNHSQRSGIRLNALYDIDIYWTLNLKIPHKM